MCWALMRLGESNESMVSSLVAAVHDRTQLFRHDATGVELSPRQAIAYNGATLKQYSAPRSWACFAWILARASVASHHGMRGQLFGLSTRDAHTMNVIAEAIIHALDGGWCKCAPCPRPMKGWRATWLPRRCGHSPRCRSSTTISSDWSETGLCGIVLFRMFKPPMERCGRAAPSHAALINTIWAYVRLKYHGRGRAVSGPASSRGPTTSS